MQFYQTRSHAIVLYNTLPATCFEKAVCMKTNDELFHRLCLPARFPLPLQKPNSRSGRQKRILKPPKRIGRKLWCNQQRQRRLQDTRHRSFCSPKTGHKSQRNGQTVDSAVRESREQGVFPAGDETDQKYKCVQREVEEIDHRRGQYRDLRALRNLFQDATPRLFSKLANRHCVLLMWKKSHTLAKKKTARQKKL